MSATDPTKDPVEKTDEVVKPAEPTATAAAAEEFPDPDEDDLDDLDGRLAVTIYSVAYTNAATIRHAR